VATFTYTARSLSGDTRTGTQEARSRADLTARLARQRLKVIKIHRVIPGAQTRGPVGRRGSVSRRDIVVFTRQFSAMISAGLPLIQTLNILAGQSGNRRLCAITREIVTDVESGATVADALARHPRAFSSLYVNMVAAGEAGGMLDTILMRLAVFMEKNGALVRKVKGAMIYPAVIMAVATVAIAALLMFVIPVFETLFGSAGLMLPLPTRAVMRASSFLKSYWHVMIGFAGAGLLALRWYRATPGGMLRTDRLLLGVPVLGDVLRKSAVSRFTRTLGTLLSSGVSILDGLEITAKTAGNRVVHDAILDSRTSIAGGDTIAAPLERSGVFPPMVISMIGVGEQTGGLDEMLSRIADFYDDEVEAAVGNLLSLLEPVIIVILGVIVGGMVVSMYLPIFDMINVVD